MDYFPFSFFPLLLTSPLIHSIDSLRSRKVHHDITGMPRKFLNNVNTKRVFNIYY